MKKHTTKTGLFGAVLVFAAVLLAASPARGQYESFFGRESWEYADAFHPITKSTADYDPYLIYCQTNIYSFTSSDTVTIEGITYYNGSAEGLWPPSVKLREDTLYGRLYSMVEGREYMVCDMSLQIGDTFRLPVLRYYDYMPIDTVLLLVDSVSFVTSKKVIHLSAISHEEVYYWWPFYEYDGIYEDGVNEYEECCNITLRFMEGVGPMYGILPPYELGEVLLCLTKDDSLYYMTHPDLGCWQDYVSVSDYPEQSITITPNPAKDQISVLLETDGDNVGDIVIRDMTGRVCLQTSMSCSTTKINVRSLSNGVYMLTYRNNSHSITKKFVKQ